MAFANVLSGEAQRDLEALIDRYGLSGVVAALVEICIEKGDHLRANWQDGQTAKVWERDGLALSAVIVKLAN